MNSTYRDAPNRSLLRKTPSNKDAPEVAAAVHPRLLSRELTRGTLVSETTDGRGVRLKKEGTPGAARNHSSGSGSLQQTDLEGASATRGWSTVLLIDRARSSRRAAEDDRAKSSGGNLPIDKAPTEASERPPGLQGFSTRWYGDFQPQEKPPFPRKRSNELYRHKICCQKGRRIAWPQTRDPLTRRPHSHQNTAFYRKYF